MNSQDNDDRNNNEEAAESSLEPIIPLKVYLALRPRPPRKSFLLNQTAYLSDIAPRLRLSVTLSKKEEEHEAKPRSVRLSTENKEKLKKHCLESELKLLDDGRIIAEDVVELFNRCKKLKGKDITRKDLEALNKYSDKSSKFQGENETPNYILLLSYS